MPAVPPLTSESAAKALGAHLNLTPRQAEVLHWVAEGKTNSEIGIILNCSIHTIKNHIKEILRRLGVSTRVAAAACAYRAHLGADASFHRPSAADGPISP